MRYALFRRGNFEIIDSETHVLFGANELSWLWFECVEVVLDELENSGLLISNEVSRVWGIGSGIASPFPFHAAGSHLKGSTANTLSRTIPSYTPTIKAFAYSRSRALRVAHSNDKKASILILTMPRTPGEDTLDEVDDEKELLGRPAKEFTRVKI
jgi:hypothetical protein